MTSYHRNVLLDALYSVEHLLWFYRSIFDRTPRAFLDEECHKDLTDFSQRVASVARAMLDDDSASRRAKQPLFRPPSPDKVSRVLAAMEARRKAKAAAAAAPSNAEAHVVPSPPADEAAVVPSPPADEAASPASAQREGEHHEPPEASGGSFWSNARPRPR